MIDWSPELAVARQWFKLRAREVPTASTSHDRITFDSPDEEVRALLRHNFVRQMIMPLAWTLLDRRPPSRYWVKNNARYVIIDEQRLRVYEVEVSLRPGFTVADVRAQNRRRIQVEEARWRAHGVRRVRRSVTK